jgi:hypothetical protein
MSYHLFPTENLACKFKNKGIHIHQSIPPHLRLEAIPVPLATLVNTKVNHGVASSKSASEIPGTPSIAVLALATSWRELVKHGFEGMVVVVVSSSALYPRAALQVGVGAIIQSINTKIT